MNSMAWPKDLVQQVGSSNVVLFVGAGASMSSENGQGARPLDWQKLLQSLAAEICSTDELASAVNPLIGEGKYLEAAEHISYIAKRDGNGNHYRDTIANLCDGPPGDQFQPSGLHAALIDLAPPVIVTTNFDHILERAVVGGYDPIQFYEPGIDNAIRQGKNIILKLHGSVKQGSKIVLTESEYVSMRRDGVLALDVLQSLLLTRMALFVGYSVNDPDLRLILSSLFGVHGRSPGHVIVTDGEIPAYKRYLFTEVYGLNAVSYPRGEHEKLAEGIQDLAMLAHAK
ncbi:SIR2 family protein [Rhodococcus sp. ARC_M5]|uniref:SIR2 family protein n=1 Tax=Rhodococcus sp. ARC_M5 TaxID=2928851 RepID=UPI001FB441FC|nr:SIR2 family protein [Rhodococcus sp. ARC_M5]MCJ0893760.1 SIR2 family protein [Rhodococcus sp. ARC_M5]